MSAQRDFSAFIASLGFRPPEEIPVGRFVRFATNGRADDDAGYAKLFPDCEGGIVGDFRTGQLWPWFANRDSMLSEPEKDAKRRRIQFEQRLAQAIREREESIAAERAKAIWDKGEAASPDHPYLVRKGVKSHGLRLYKGSLEIAGMRCDGSLMVPVTGVANDLQTVGFISADRQQDNKRFLPKGRKAGGSYMIGKPNSVLCIAEGYATSASIHEATGYAVAVAFDKANLLLVAKAMRDKYPQSRLVVCADNDGRHIPNGGTAKATEAAAAVDGIVVIPDLGGEKCDFNDLARIKGPEAVKAVVDLSLQRVVPGLAPAPPSSQKATNGLAEELTRLAALSPIEYDRQRKAAAEGLGVRVETLDAEVRRVRGDEADGAAEDTIFAKLEPWAQPVDGAELLSELAQKFRRFIVLPQHSDTALALFVLLTYFADVIDVAPILAAVSPEKRCGKTSLLALLRRLVHRPLATANISPASVFRAVEKWSPTLLIDEADAFLRENDELRGILNSGHTRDTAYVIRTVGDEHEPKHFSTWGPKVIALIGTLPDTLADRSIIVELQRKHASERVEKLRHAGDEIETLARRCMRFAQDNREKIRGVRPLIPEDLHDRAADNWEPLLAIADLAGGDWSAWARRAASVLSGATPDGDSVKVDLLRDIRALLAEPLAGRAVVGSEELVHALTQDQTTRWAEYSRGKPLTQRQLAQLLRPFRIVPGTVRLPDNSTPKGYRVKSLAEAFARYLPPFDPPHRHTPANTRVVADQASATEPDCGGSSFPPQASKGDGRGGVAAENHGVEGAGEVL